MADRNCSQVFLTVSQVENLPIELKSLFFRLKLSFLNN